MSHPDRHLHPASPLDVDIDDHEDHDHDDHDRGLQFDVANLMTRRRALTVLGGLGAAGVLAGCRVGGSKATAASSTTTSPSSTTTSAATSGSSTTTTAASGSSTTTTALSAIPEETAGPYPGDGSNGPDVLTQTGIVRRDIRSSFGSSSTVAAGVPLSIALTLVSAADGFAPLVGAAVYVWHCNQAGQYSMYSQGVTGENYLRGVQETGSDGSVTFSSIFPAAYSGRWPHIHFEVYPSLAAATSAGTKLRTSQMALPEDACQLVYATDGYGASVANLARTSLATDMVFSDGWSSELGTVTGTPGAGMTAALAVAV